MKVILEGEFISNDSYTNRETGVVTPYCTLLAGNETVRIKGCTAPPDKKRFDIVKIPVDIRVYNNRLYFTYSK